MITQQLMEINKELKESVPNINYGGCAYYAALISQRLTELGHTSEPAAISYHKPEGANHVFVIVTEGFDRYIHDGHRTQPAWSTFWDYQVLDEDLISVVENNRWNEWFDAYDGVPKMVKAIERVFGKFEHKPHFHNVWTGEIAA